MRTTSVGALGAALASAACGGTDPSQSANVAGTRASSEIAGCPVFPADDPWNEDISAAPVDPASDAFLARMAPERALRLGFGVEPFYGIPVTVVPSDQPEVPITFGTDGLDYSAESDRGPFPIPLDAPIQGGRPGQDATEGDRHMVVVQEGTCRAFELFNAERTGDGFRASSAVWWDLRAPSWPRRPPGWTSADGAGLPLLPGLIRWEEASTGTIAHAIRFTAPAVRRAYVAPANHCGPTNDARLPPFGTRLRLRADFDLSPYTGATRTILEALQRYGMILADVGTPWTLGGTSDPGFADTVRQLRAHPVPGSAFEVVRLGAVRTDC